MGTEHEHEAAEHSREGLGHRVIVDQIPAGAWRVDPASSQINIRARSAFGLLPVNGFFGRFAGELRSDLDGEVSGTLDVEADSIVTGIDARDERLRSPEFFDAARYPRMTFRLAAVSRRGRPEMRFSEEERMSAIGVLRLRDKEIGLEFPVTVIAHGDHLHVECKVRIDHHAAGLGWTRPGIVGRTTRAEVALTLNPVGVSG